MIEVLVSLLVLSLGVFALMGLQASAARFATDAQLRATATFLADQLVARMLISAPASASGFAHNAVKAGAASEECNYLPSASAEAQVTQWLADVAANLPGAPSEEQSIRYDSANGVVTVVICWQAAGGDTRFVKVENQVQWQ